MAESFEIRRVTLADAAIVARHRAEMFQDMGLLPADLHDTLVEQSTQRLRTMIPSGEYVGWLLTPVGRPDVVLAGAGLQLRRTLPHPSRTVGAREILSGRQALVINVFTEAPWRRRGLALQLMRHVIAWCDEEGVETIVLHASDEGRPLYERLGFVATNEMRLPRRATRAKSSTSAVRESGKS